MYDLLVRTSWSGNLLSIGRSWALVYREARHELSESWGREGESKESLVGGKRWSEYLWPLRDMAASKAF